MITTTTQRWTRGRDRYRPAGETIRPDDYFVEPIAEAPAKAFVLEHHYSRSYPAARFRAGLYRRRPFFEPELVGVAVFSVPMQRKAVARWAGTDAGVELGRFVLVDDVPGNGETFFLARAFRQLRQALPELRAVVSYSDPVPRRAGGRLVLPGHVGTIYQAFNGRYHGRGSARTLRLAGDGSIVSERMLSKLRRGERGRDYAEARLVELGAPARRPHEGGADYVRRALAAGPFTRFRHPGNHVYTWALQRLETGSSCAEALPYPKLPDRLVAAA